MSPIVEPVRRTSRRRVLAIVALALLTAVVVRYGLIIGWWTPVRIVGPSMAIALQGRHGAVTCAACQFTFPFDIEREPPPARLLCPNCGHRHDSPDYRELLGDRVLIDPVPLRWRRPRRMEIVAFDHPENPGERAVKRIIGMPGEKISIRGGEIYVDGRLWQKSLADQHALRTLVHDNRYLPSGATQWQSQDDWLEFHPPRIADLPETVAVPPNITDHDAYNPALARTVSDVFDIALRGNVVHTRQGAMRWRIDDGWSLWELQYDLKSQTVTLARDDEEVASFHDAAARSASFDFEVVVIDQQIALAVNGDLVLHHAYEAASNERKLRGAVLAIRCTDQDAVIRNLRVERDIYWLDPGGLGEAWESELAEDEYLLLGDNVTVSNDSRHFGPVKAQALKGFVSHRQ